MEKELQGLQHTSGEIQALRHAIGEAKQQTGKLESELSRVKAELARVRAELEAEREKTAPTSHDAIEGMESALIRVTDILRHKEVRGAGPWHHMVAPLPLPVHYRLQSTTNSHAFFWLQVAFQSHTKGQHTPTPMTKTLSTMLSTKTSLSCLSPP